MPIELKMPALSPTMEEGTLAKWLVKEGDEVKSGDILAEIETDKATMEFEAVDEGTIAKILVPEGTDGVKVGQPIALLAGEGEQVSAPAPKPEPEAQPKPEPEAKTKPASTEAPSIPAPESQQHEATLTPHQMETAARDPVAAMGGLRPIVEFMTFNFAMQAIDAIVNSAAKTNYMSGGQMRCPVVFRGPNGAAARVAAQHSQNYASWYAHVPGLIVIAPYSAADAKGLLKAAIRTDDPVVFLENELLYGQHFDVPQLEDYLLPIGKARVVRPGKDVTIVSYSIGVGVALEAAQELMGQGINAEVIDLRTLRPLDKATVLESLKRTNRMVVVEEGWPVCSISSELIAIAMTEGFDDLDAPVLRVTDVDVPLPYAANLEKLALIKASDVVEAAKAVCYR